MRRQGAIVTGKWFHRGCDDSGSGCGAPIDPQSPLRDIELTLHQAQKRFVLGVTDASDRAEMYSAKWVINIPNGVVDGPAELRADAAALSVTISS